MLSEVDRVVLLTVGPKFVPGVEAVEGDVFDVECIGGLKVVNQSVWIFESKFIGKLGGTGITGPGESP